MPSLEESKIIPDVVDKFDPQGLLTIDYDATNKVLLGNTLKVSDTQHKPQITFTYLGSEPIKHDDKFILVMTDPDAPSHTDHKWSEYLHWIVKDLSLQGDGNTYTLDYSTGNEIFSYIGPGPPPKTGLHAYTFLLYKQDPQATLTPPKDRPNWGTGIPKSGVRDWIKKDGANSSLLAANFFYAQNVEQ